MSPFSETANAGSSVNSFFTQPVSLRIIPLHTYPGALNMAIDEWFARNQNGREGILRFYGWQPYCVSIGVHQDDTIIDRAMLTRMQADLVRRPTGGRAIYHAEELTYSVVFPKNMIGHRELYTFIHLILAAGLRDLGYAVAVTGGGPPVPPIRHTAADYACFSRSAQSEIHYNGRKVVGSAQKIYPESILQHGSVMIGRAHLQLSAFLNGKSAEKSKIGQELRRRTAALSEIPGVGATPAKIVAAVLGQLESLPNLSIYSEDLTPAEIEQVQACTAG